jgi:membrane-associated protease RseP (regulator of RpoE activity)
MLGLFNLIPGLPLDGGNILKALVWKITGNPYKGVKFASRVGQAFGWMAIASGLLPLLSYGGSLNFWNVLVGWFLLQNAGRAAQFATVQEQLAGLTAADVVTPNSPIVAATTSLRDFADQRIVNQDVWRKFLVTNAEGQLVSELMVSDLKAVPNDRWSTMTVGELAKPIAITDTISWNQPLIDVIKMFETKQLSALAVIQENGILVGLIEKAAIAKLLQQPA